MDEARLIRQLQRGNTAALEQMISRYTAYVGACVWRVMGAAMAHEDLEEVVSDVFVCLWAHAADLDPARGTLRAWLGATAANAAKNKLRGHAMTYPLREDDAAPDMPAALVERQDTASRLWQAVQSLGEPDSQIFFRYYYEGEKLKDIAADLGLKLPTAKTRLARGRKALRGLLESDQKGGLCHE